MDAAQKEAIRTGNTPDRLAYACFGTEWDPREPVCAGGVDYVKGQTQHKKCPYFETCGQEKAAEFAARQQRPLPISQLTRPPIPLGGPTMPAVRVAPSFGAPAAQPQPQPPYSNLAALAARASTGMTQPQPQQPQYPGMYTPPPQGAVHPVYIAQDYGMPQYLREPEPQYDDESVVVPLAYELLRGALKGLMHTGASFVDRYAFRKRRP